MLPVQQVDDIDEVHQLDPVHQVDHKDEFSNMICYKKHTIRWISLGSKNDFFQLFLKCPGDILRGLILNRLSFWRGSWSILKSFLVNFFRHLEMAKNGQKWSWGCPPGSAPSPGSATIPRTVGWRRVMILDAWVPTDPNRSSEARDRKSATG